MIDDVLGPICFVDILVDLLDFIPLTNYWLLGFSLTMSTS